MPVVWFTSQSYDLNVLKSPLMRPLTSDAVEDGGGDVGDDNCYSDSTTRLMMIDRFVLSLSAAMR